MSKKTQKIIKIASGIVVLTAIVYGGYLLYSWATAPTSGSVTVSRDRTGNENNANTDQKITTSYYDTSIPRFYRLQVNTQPNPPHLVQASAVNYRQTVNEIGIVAGPLPQEGIEGVSDYKFRQSYGEIYAPYDMDYNFDQGNVMSFRKNDQTELSLFVISPNNTYASITLTSQSPVEGKLDKIAQDILNRWKWQ